MTNTPPRMTPFQQLVAHLEAGSEVKIGGWTFTKSSRYATGSPDGLEKHFFAAMGQHPQHNNGETRQTLISVTPSAMENLTGMQVDLVVEIMKTNHNFDGQSFSTPVGTARAPQRRTQSPLSI